MARITLTMIVRDEAEIIERCLDSARPHIDSYVICDTGSTDDTVERIENALSDLPGTIHHRRWVDFGHNRTELAELASGVADHQLLLDADMTLDVDGALPPLEPGIAYLARHHGEVEYLAPRLIDGKHPWRWQGSTHEHLDSSSSYRVELLQGVSVVHHGDGADQGRRRFERDRELLERDLADNPDDPRTRFYLGLVLLGLGETAAARSHLLWRVDCGAPPADERYFAALRVAQIDAQTGVNALASARRVVRLDRSRAEGRVHLAAVLRQMGRPRAGRRAASRARARKSPPLASFVVPGATSWEAKLEMTRCSLDMGRRHRVIASATRLLESAEADTRARTAGHELVESAWMVRPPPKRRSPLTSLRPTQIPTDIGWRVELDCLPRWRTTNPSIVATPAGLILTTKLTNAGSSGGPYEFSDRSRRVRVLNARIDLDHELNVVGTDPIDDPGYTLQAQHAPTVGTEDLRPIRVGESCLALGWAREFGRPNVCGPVIVDLDNGPPRLLPQPDPDRHEKNWMPFMQGGRLMVATRIDPLTVYEITSDGGLELVAAAPATGVGVTWRGGSQGVPFDEGWLFVVHERLTHRNSFSYQHRFALIDSAMTLVAATDPFVLTGAAVEFVGGLAWWQDRLLLGLGIHDATAQLRAVDSDWVRSALREPVLGRVESRRRRELERWPALLSTGATPAPYLSPINQPLRTHPGADGRMLPRAAVIHGARLSRM